MTLLVRRLLLLALLGACMTAAVDPRVGLVGMALADDDDDGGDDDDDDDDGDDDDDDDDRGGRSASRDDDGDDDDDRPRFFRRQAPAPVAPARVAPPPPPPPAYRPEIVAMNLSAGDLGTLLNEGFTLLEEQTLPEFDATLRRLRAPSELTLAAARERVRALPSGLDADFNHYYRTEQGVCEGPHCASVTQIGWTMPDTREMCGPDIAIGMVDTGLNPEHVTFDGARLTVHRLDASDTPSRPRHGTSVAALLVGAPEGRSPGLVPDMRLVAVDAFQRVGGDERSDAFTLIRALAYLADAEVRIINLSLAGPSNEVLEQAINRLLGDGISVVAAAGNAGQRAAPEYPAAYDGVIAVTAVDRQGDAYRRAGQGEHLDLAAPGVEVWTAASISGGRPKTGTSFAAPFVTAAAARLIQNEPEATPSEIARMLAEGAEDLGKPGHDPVFGHGLVGAQTCPAPVDAPDAVPMAEAEQPRP